MYNKYILYVYYIYYIYIYMIYDINIYNIYIYTLYVKKKVILLLYKFDKKCFFYLAYFTTI